MSLFRFQKLMLLQGLQGSTIECNPPSLCMLKHIHVTANDGAHAERKRQASKGEEGEDRERERIRCLLTLISIPEHSLCVPLFASESRGKQRRSIPGTCSIKSGKTPFYGLNPCIDAGARTSSYFFLLTNSSNSPSVAEHNAVCAVFLHPTMRPVDLSRAPAKAGPRWWWQQQLQQERQSNEAGISICC